MIGSRLLGSQPTFRGSDFEAPEIAMFGFDHFREAIATTDTWERHDGTEIVFVRSGEACWEFGNHDLATVTGSHAVCFPAGVEHRVLNGVYTPCTLLWVLFEERDVAVTRARMFPRSDLACLLDVAGQSRAPIRLEAATTRTMSQLVRALTDERLFIGSTPLMADVRAKLCGCVVDLWQACGRQEVEPETSELVRQAIELLHADLDRPSWDDQESIDAIARRLHYGKSRLYTLFAQEVGMSPNDYRQRLRVRRCCDRLLESDESVTSIAVDCGFSSSQYFARVFRKYVGVSPTHYRRMFAGSNGQGPS